MNIIKSYFRLFTITFIPNTYLLLVVLVICCVLNFTYVFFRWKYLEVLGQASTCQQGNKSKY